MTCYCGGIWSSAANNSILLGSHIERSQHFKVHIDVIFKGHCNPPGLHDLGRRRQHIPSKHLEHITVLSCCAMSYPRKVSVPDKCSLSIATWLNVWVCNILEHCVKKLLLRILLLVCHWSNWHVHFWGRINSLKWEDYFRNCTKFAAQC